MPYANEMNPEDKLLRTFLYGEAKTKKTWWACKWAELGFNVVLLDGDDGSMITNQLSKEAQSRILVVDLVMRNDKPVFAPFLAQFLRANNSFTWDEQDKNKVYSPKSGHSNIVFDAAKLTENDIVILDSWTALAQSTLFQWAAEQQIDLSDLGKEGRDTRGEFGTTGNFLNWVIARLHTLPCQLIVIGHATVYEKWDNRDKKNPKLLETRVQPMSSSGPHAKKLASHFTDVMYFSRMSSVAYKIDTSGDRDRDGGSRLFEPKMYDWNELGPKEFAAKLGLKPTGKPCLGAQWFAAGQEIPNVKASVSVLAAVPSTNTPTQITAPQTSGIRGLLSKNKGA